MGYEGTGVTERHQEEIDGGKNIDEEMEEDLEKIRRVPR